MGLHKKAIIIHGNLKKLGQFFIPIRDNGRSKGNEVRLNSTVLSARMRSITSISTNVLTGLIPAAFGPLRYLKKSTPAARAFL